MEDGRLSSLPRHRLPAHTSRTATAVPRTQRRRTPISGNPADGRNLRRGRGTPVVAAGLRLASPSAAALARRSHAHLRRTLAHNPRNGIRMAAAREAPAQQPHMLARRDVVHRGAPGCTRMRCVYHTIPACERARAPCTTSALPADLLSILTLTLPRRTFRNARAPSREVDRDVAPRSEKDVLCACC